MPDWSTVLDFVGLYLIPGLVTGSIYALGAIGVSLLFGILRFAHFALELLHINIVGSCRLPGWSGWPTRTCVGGRKDCIRRHVIAFMVNRERLQIVACVGE